MACSLLKRGPGRACASRNAHGPRALSLGNADGVIDCLGYHLLDHPLGQNCPM